MRRSSQATRGMYVYGYVWSWENIVLLRQKEQQRIVRTNYL